MKEHPRIIFFGTPDFAVASLGRLVGEGYPVAAVVTAPDKPAGRGLKLTPSPVKTFAFAKGIPVLQPISLRDPGFLDTLAGFRPDLQIVIAFRMLPRVVWALPPLGTFNLHASLLPQYRGAAPINHALINGETETGVTTFFINETIDTGRILLSERLPVGSSETAGELHDRLKVAGAELVVRTVEGIATGNIREIPQETLTGSIPLLKEAPKIFRENCRIDWNAGVGEIHNRIRGLSPYPGAFTEMSLNDGAEHLIKILRAEPEPSPVIVAPGSLQTDGKTWIRIAAKDGFIRVLKIQIAGRSVMDIPVFLRGFAWLLT
jgi:methionyl-tRNA formyltransferase